MKPVKLTMQSFGSYGKKTVIDFTEPNQNLFLITGDTGSGKTTIFDAMVFALYGDVSSSDSVREGSEIQSHYADTNVRPFVELVFSENIDGEDRMFTVNRTPQHFENKKRGTGTTKKGEEVSLILSDGTDYTANLKETNEKITEIVGFTKEQFMQVGMIAQGEFMKVLRENTASKKQIFSKLFNTQIFQKITEELKERCRAKKGDIEEIKIQYRHLTGQIEVPEDYSDAELMTEIKNRVLSSDSINSYDMDLLTEKLSLMCSDLNDRKNAAEKVLKNEEKNKEQLIEKLSAAFAVSDSFKHLREAEENLKKYAAEKDNIEKMKVLAAEIEKSYEIKTRFEAFEETEKALSVLHKNLAEAENTLPENTEKKNAAEAEENREKKNIDKINADFSKLSERVEKANEKFAKIDILLKKLSLKETEISKAKDELESSENAHKDLQNRIKSGKILLEKLNGADRNFEILQMKLNSYNLFEKDIKNITNLRNTTSEIHKEAEKLRREYKKYDDVYNTLNQEYNTKRKIYFDSQAGLLAKELKENTPCPVCGSLSHPSPCMLPEDIGNITLDELNSLDEKARTAGDKAAKISEKISGLNGRIGESEKNIEQNIDSLRTGLSEYISDLSEKMTLESLTDSYINFRTELKKKCSKAEQNAKSLEKLNNEIKTDSELFEKQTGEIENSRVYLTELSNELAGISAELNQIRSDVDFNSKAEADESLNKAAACKKEEEDKYAAIRKQLDTAQKVLTQNETVIKKLKADIPLYAENSKHKKEEYLKSVSESRISEEKWKEIVSAYPKSDKDVFYRKINAYNSAVTAAVKAKENAGEIIKGQPEPDIDKISALKTESEIRCTELRKIFDRLKECDKADRKVLDELEPLKNRSMDTVGKYTVLKSLYDRLSGNVTNSRMDLETFVQRYYLQRILDSANKRFYKMSAGQYELRMFDEESASRGSNKGLDLKVYSTVTRKEREVGTLSGGESFMAALSLALGMSDQIQENTSAINLDVMFIDEGFGSLDDHSRNQAIRVLQQMAGGSKLIGIISHVTELKQEIDNQLAVTKDNEGSHARWMIS